MGDVILLEPGAALVTDADSLVLDDVGAFAARTAWEPFWLDATDITAPFRAALAAVMAEARRVQRLQRPVSP